MNTPLTGNKSTCSAGFSLLSAKCPGIVPSRPALACVTVLAAQDPKTTYALGSTGSEPCQPGPLVVRGIAAGQLDLELEWTPVGNLNMDLEGHEVLMMSFPPEKPAPASSFWTWSRPIC